MGDSGAAIEGRLSEVPLESLLTRLATEEATGILHVDGDGVAVVCLDRGRLYLATSERGPSLRALVVGSGVTSAADWDLAYRETRHGAGLAAALVSHGADTDHLWQVLREHTVATVFELMVPGEGRFSFERGEVHPLGPTFTSAVDEVLTDTRHRVEQWKAIAESVPSTSVVFRAAPRLPTVDSELTLRADEWQVLIQIDGSRSVADLITSLGLSPFTVCATLHRLVTAGALELADPQPRAGRSSGRG